MKRNFLLSAGLILTCVAAALAQSGPVPGASPANGAGQGQPVSYASVTQLNGLLAQIEEASKNTQSDLSRLRIEKWKASGNEKKQALGNVESIQRNLQEALPEIMGQLKNSPEDLNATFKLYRNLDALYDVLNYVADMAGAFGSKDDMQSVSNDISAFEGPRKQLAERIENLSSSKEAEISQLRTQVKALRAQVEAEPPKKVIVDDTEPAKKPAPKKRTTKKTTHETKHAAEPQEQSKPQ